MHHGVLSPEEEEKLEVLQMGEKMLNRVKERFGSDCIIFWGDWSMRDQMTIPLQQLESRN